MKKETLLVLEARKKHIQDFHYRDTDLGECVKPWPWRKTNTQSNKSTRVLCCDAVGCQRHSLGGGSYSPSAYSKHWGGHGQTTWTQSMRDEDLRQETSFKEETLIIIHNTVCQQGKTKLLRTLIYWLHKRKAKLAAWVQTLKKFDIELTQLDFWYYLFLQVYMSNRILVFLLTHVLSYKHLGTRTKPAMSEGVITV